MTEQNIFHRDLAVNGRWQTLSLLEQMANIGSEVGRAIKWREQKESERSILAAYRALELFDFSLNDSKHRHRMKEITRARECFADFFFGENEFSFTSEWWQKYFLDFAVAARNKR